LRERKKMTDEILKTKAGTGGSLQSDWTGTDFPVSEWSSDIIGEALLESPFVECIVSSGMLKRGNKKTFFMISSVTTATNLWATGTTDVASATYETPLDYNDNYIDPVEYRTYTPVAWETKDEIGSVIEADVRKALALHARRKIGLVAYQALEDGAIASDYDWIANGNALTYLDTNTAVDWGDEFTIDVFNSGFETVIATGYIPNFCILPPAMYCDCFNQSQFMNAAQFGAQNTAITEGKVPRYMGVDILLDNWMPDDNSNKDVGVMADFRYLAGLVVSNTGRIDFAPNYNTGQDRFYMTLKAGATVFHEDAGVAFYS
jgi:hypothetical protein